MTAPDIEGVLAAHELWPRPNRLGHLLCDCGLIIGEAGVGADIRGEIPSLHRAHVAAVLREQITAAQAEAWGDGWVSGIADVARWGRDEDVPATPNPYRAAQVAPSRVPGEET